MKNASDIEIHFDGMTTKMTAEPAAIFRIVSALRNDGREVEIRYHDEELGEKTCWQPMKKAA